MIHDEFFRLIKIFIIAVTYGLEYADIWSLRTLFNDLKEFGIDIKEFGRGPSCVVYVDEKPIKQDDIKNIVFAVTTNPMI